MAHCLVQLISYSICALSLAHHSPISSTPPASIAARTRCESRSQLQACGSIKGGECAHPATSKINTCKVSGWAVTSFKSVRVYASMLLRPIGIMNFVHSMQLKHTLGTHLGHAAQSNDGAPKCDDIDLIALTNHACRSRHRQKVTLHRKKPLKTLHFEHGGRVTSVRGQLDFPDQPQVHVEPPPGYSTTVGKLKLK